jgi:hypothetical protein
MPKIRRITRNFTQRPHTNSERTSHHADRIGRCDAVAWSRSCNAAGEPIGRRTEAMSCTKHVLNLSWERHAWRRLVTSTDTVPTRLTDMWGRVISSEYVRCQTQEVCEACGTIRSSATCLCDTARADACAIRRTWLDASTSLLASRESALRE